MCPPAIKWRDWNEEVSRAFADHPIVARMPGFIWHGWLRVMFDGGLTRLEAAVEVHHMLNFIKESMGIYARIYAMTCAEDPSEN